MNSIPYWKQTAYNTIIVEVAAIEEYFKCLDDVIRVPFYEPTCLISIVCGLNTLAAWFGTPYTCVKDKMMIL